MMTTEVDAACERSVDFDAVRKLSQQSVQRENPMLVHAAFSHLELAIVNMEAQMPSLSAQDQSAISRTVARLRDLAGKMSTLGDGASGVASIECPVEQEAIDLERAFDTREEIVKTVETTEPMREHSTALVFEDDMMRLMDVFDQIDVNGSGLIEFNEWTAAIVSLGLPLSSGKEAFRCADKNSNGVIDRTEWKRMLENVQEGDMNDEDSQALTELVDALTKAMSKNGRIYSEPTPVESVPCCIILPDSPLRMCWDVLITLVLFYISVMLPYTIGFAVESDALRKIDNTFDVVFILDVCFNFRTAYFDHDECLRLEWRQIAGHYLKTWFLLDFTTCVPFELVSEGVLPDMHAAKLLKIGKIMKILKLLRLSKLYGLIQDSEVLEYCEDQMLNTNHQAMFRLICMLLSMCLLCHWLACFMASSGHHWSIVGKKVSMDYSTALYWSMMTLTTVGFGDIIPLGIWERAYAIGCMAVGGFFYGLLIGKIASIISSRDLNAKAYYERMEIVQSWLFYHCELPKQLRRRIKKHYQKHLMKKAATDDHAIINDLSPALLHEVSVFLVQEEVKNNILFHSLPNCSFAYLMPLLENVFAESHESIVNAGEPGVAMYIITQGKAYFAKGHQWNAPVDQGADKPELAKYLTVGNSFGEEVILGLEETYRYTVAAKTSMTLLSISREGFERTFKRMPDIKLKMHRSFVLGGGYAQQNEVSRKRDVRGRGSLMDGATHGLPHSFPDAVLDALEELSQRLERTEQKFDDLRNPIRSLFEDRLSDLRPNRLARGDSSDFRKHQDALPNPSPIQPPVSKSLKESLKL